jgi:hypothetical protein
MMDIFHSAHVADVVAVAARALMSTKDKVLTKKKSIESEGHYFPFGKRRMRRVGWMRRAFFNITNITLFSQHLRTCIIIIIPP